MLLETKNKQINLILKTKNIIKICKALGNKNFEDAYFNAVNDNDIESLVKILIIISEDNNGNNAFNTSDEVSDFIDDYIKEKKHLMELHTKN